MSTTQTSSLYFYLSLKSTVMNPKLNFIKSEWLKSLLVIPVIILALTVFSLSASGQKSTSAKKEVAPPPPTPPPPPPPPVPQSTDKKAVSVMTDGAYRVVDVMPEFPGGDSTLLKYIADSTHYPKDAKTQAIQGKVIVRFMIKANGSVSEVSVLKGVSPSLDEESIRVVKTLPKFTPGKLNGKTVPVWYMIPISFKLK
jgi:TonB family protein